MTANQMK